MEKLTLVKIGGQIIDDEPRLDDFLQDFANLDGKKILVHGGGKSASQLMRKMGIEPKMVDGRRITDEAALEVVTMVYGGVLNKKMVAHLQANDCQALGLSGADGDTICAVKRPVKEIDYGFVGDVIGVNTSVIETLLNSDVAPVFCALTHDGRGQLLNTNADTIASSLAVALSKIYEVDLVFCFEKNGVLSDIEDENSVVELINRSNYEKFKNSGVISDGMIPKIDNAFDSLKNGVSSVYITNFSSLKERKFETGEGTKINY